MKFPEQMLLIAFGVGLAGYLIAFLGRWLIKQYFKERRADLRSMLNDEEFNDKKG